MRWLLVSLKLVVRNGSSGLARGIQPPERHIERVQFAHLLDCPHPFLSMPAHHVVPMTGRAETHTGVLKPLLNVMRF